MATSARALHLRRLLLRRPALPTAAAPPYLLGRPSPLSTEAHPLPRSEKAFNYRAMFITASLVTWGVLRGTREWSEHRTEQIDDDAEKEEDTEQGLKTGGAGKIRGMVLWEGSKPTPLEVEVHPVCLCDQCRVKFITNGVSFVKEQATASAAAVVTSHEDVDKKLQVQIPASGFKTGKCCACQHPC